MKTKKSLSGISRAGFLRAVVLGIPLLPATAALAQTGQPGDAAASNVDPGNLRAFVELARSNIRTEKAYLIAQNMDFTADEAVVFWPLQREYETQLNNLLDQRYDGILQFAHNYGTMTDAQATDLAHKSFDIEEQRTKLKRKYFKSFCKVIPAVKAARFFQIENQLNMVLDLKVAAALPLIK